MLRQGLGLGLALMMASGAFAEESPHAVTEVQELNARLEAAIASGNPARIAPFFAPEFHLQNSANRILPANAVLAQFASGAVRFAAYERNVEVAYQSGDVVVLMGSEKVRPQPANAEAAGEPATRRFTSVWRRFPEGWKQIARQSTNVD